MTLAHDAHTAFDGMLSVILCHVFEKRLHPITLSHIPSTEKWYTAKKRSD